HAAFDLRERQPLRSQVVLRAEPGIVYSDRGIFPVDVRQDGLANRREIRSRPGTVPDQLDGPALELRTSCDRSRLGQIKTDVIVRVHSGLAEIGHRTLGLQVRASRSRLQRT